MGKYYLGGVGLGILLFIVMAIIGGVGNCAIRSQEQSRVEDMYRNTVVVRYYKDEAPTNVNNYTGSIGAIRVWKGNEIERITVPTKPGMTFAGLFDTPQYIEGVSEMYVDQEGRGVDGMVIWEETILYALYVHND